MRNVYEATKKWRKNNPEKYRAQIERGMARRRSRLLEDELYRCQQALVVSNRNAKVGGYFPIRAEAAELIFALKEQNYLCRICGAYDGEIRKFRLMPDHCHTTGKFRGWLCIGCNLGIGRYEKYQSAFEKYLNS